MVVMAKGGRLASTTVCNFLFRMGHPKSEFYLVNPAVAASAVKGRIAHSKEAAKRRGGNG
jgi:3-isopropylmalate/(R)-2-methylmalate dehydratase large subunit